MHYCPQIATIGAKEAAVSNVQKVSVALTPEMVAMLKDAVDAGEYTSASEVVREALRAWKTRRMAREWEVDELRKLWAEGLASGPPMKGRPAFRRLRDKYAKQAAEK
jgi:antitoxin ParD1/3/4